MTNQLTALNTFAKAVWETKKVTQYNGILLSLDPGETTGWAVWRSYTGEEITLLGQGQIPTWPIERCVEEMTRLFESYPHIKHVVHETYAIYEWKSSDHSWSQVPTVQVIGSILTLCVQRQLTYSSQTAQIAKNFCTDDKLKYWDVYEKGLRHSRDAVRHGIYFLLFRPDLT